MNRFALVAVPVMLLMLAACSGPTSAPAPHHASPSPTKTVEPGPSPTKTVEPGQALTIDPNEPLTKLLSDWDSAIASASGNNLTARLYVVSIALPHAVQRDCSSKLNAVQTAYLAELAAAAEAEIAQANATNGGFLRTIDIYKAWDGYVRYVKFVC